MPTYEYECQACGSFPELNVPIDERDMQKCSACDTPLSRKFTFTGLTWAPTAGGMR